MNNKFLEEAKNLEARWAKSGLLEGIDKKFDRQSAAVLLECQRLHNETGTWDCCDECREREKQEKAAFFLMWYSAEDNEDHLVGEEKLSLDEAQLRKWFWIQGNDFFGCEIVRASQLKQLQPFVKHQIDLNKYDYFVEHLIDNEQQ